MFSANSLFLCHFVRIVEFLIPSFVGIDGFLRLVTFLRNIFLSKNAPNSLPEHLNLKIISVTYMPKLQVIIAT